MRTYLDCIPCFLNQAPSACRMVSTDELQRAFREADLIISKGQGNYETLSEVDRNVFFLLKAKCRRAALDLGCQVGDVVVAHRAPRTT